MKTMSFWKNIEESSVEYHLKKLENDNVPGLDEVFQGFETIKELGVYKDLHDCYRVLDPSKNIPEKSLFILAKHHMSDPSIVFPFKIVFGDIYNMYWLLGLIFYAKTQNTSETELFNQIINCNLDKNLILHQNDFDKTENDLKLSTEFFQKLQLVKWKNRGVRRFFDKIDNLRTDFAYHNFDLKFPILFILDFKFIRLMAACSAVRNDRDRINKNDVINGYKTYIKLLTTDLTKYPGINEWKVNENNGGYLVCDQCNEYYHLHNKESPKDFTDQCKCGGKLHYYLEDQYNPNISNQDNNMPITPINQFKNLLTAKVDLNKELKAYGVIISILALIEFYFAIDIFLNIKGEPFMLILSFLIGIGLISIGILSFSIVDKKIFWTYTVALAALLLQSLFLSEFSMTALQIIIFLALMAFFIIKATTKNQS